MMGLALYSLEHESTNTEISLQHHIMFSDIQCLFFFKAPWATLNIPALPLEFRFPWSQGHSVTWCPPPCLLLPMTWSLPALCSGCNWPCQTHLCFPGSLSCLTVLICPLLKRLLSFLFDHLFEDILHLFSPLLFKKDELFKMFLTIFFLYHVSGMMN